MEKTMQKPRAGVAATLTTGPVRYPQVGQWEARRASQVLPISAGMGRPPTADGSCLKLALMARCH